MSDRGLAVSATGLVKSYESGSIRALRGVDLDISAGEFVAIMGPSGCGKSTLLHILGGLDVPDEGEVRVGDRSLAGGDLTDYRSSQVGFVFQLHNLIPVLTAKENVEVPMLGAGGPPADVRRGRAADLLRDVGLEERARARPPQLSGGERQRVALARALANRPGVILADEPTGAIDQETGRMVLDLLSHLQTEYGTTLVLVTHDERVAERAGRILRMIDGRIVDP